MKDNKHISDNQLKKWLKQMSEGDTEALKLFYETLYRDVFLFVCSQINDYNLTEDIVQETFLSVYQSAERFEGKSSVKTWVFSIVRHHCLRAMTKTRFDDSGEESFGITGDFSRIESKEALEHLDQIEREVIILYAVCGFRIKEIAPVLSLTEKQVYYRKQAAIQKLRAYYSQNRS